MKLSQAQRQAMAISPRQLQGIKLLAKSLPELRAEILAEMASNPAIEDVEHVLETPLSEVEHEHEIANMEPDYPEDDFEPGLNNDEMAADRKQAFIENRVKEETLQEHLFAQLPLSDIPHEDWAMIETLIGDLDDNGYYHGSIPDVAMAFDKSENDVRAALHKIMEFDPLGCGAISAKECLFSQLDTIESPKMRSNVRRIIEDHLENLAAGKISEIGKALSLSREETQAAINALRSLDGRPGRRFPSEHNRVEYVNPEIHAVKVEGHWVARMDARSLPEIRLSKAFQNLLNDAGQSDETKAYIRERIKSANDFRMAVVKRQETVGSIAQAIFDRQQEFFEHGFKALKPMTEMEIAKEVKVSISTVSRTVRDKYAATPQGTIELRRFFTIGYNGVLDALKGIVEGEDGAKPLSDGQIVSLLGEKGFSVARRTVAKYREQLGIPVAAERAKKI